LKGYKHNELNDVILRRAKIACGMKGLFVSHAIMKSSPGTSLSYHMRMGGSPGVDKILGMADYIGLSVGALAGASWSSENDSLLHLRPPGASLGIDEIHLSVAAAVHKICDVEGVSIPQVQAEAGLSKDFALRVASWPILTISQSMSLAARLHMSIDAICGRQPIDDLWLWDKVNLISRVAEASVAKLDALTDEAPMGPKSKEALLEGLEKMMSVTFGKQLQFEHE
jgi:hypothetical protein